MTQVDLELREKWLQALESGEYKQGRTYLHRSNGLMCCLGVACVVAGIPRTYNDFKVENGVEAYEYDFDRAKLNAFISTELALKLGIESYTSRLVSMNDDGGASFKEIAAYVRARGVSNSDAED